MTASEKLEAFKREYGEALIFSLEKLSDYLDLKDLERAEREQKISDFKKTLETKPLETVTTS